MHDHLFFLLLVGWLLCPACTSPHQDKAPQQDPREAEIARLMAQYHEAAKFNGTALVAEKDHIIYRQAWGVADVEQGIPLEPTTQFYLASVAKQFTCMAIMMLEAEGKLSVDDYIRRFFPDLPVWADSVRLRHLMNHTSGIPDYYDLGIARPGFTNADVYDALLKVDKLDFTPNSQYAYSNSGYVLLSMVIERVSGQSFKQFMESRIFQPLNMKHSLVFDAQTPPIPGRAIGYTPDLKRDDYQFYTTGGGGIFSNVDDLFLWNRALYTDQLISQQKLQQAYTPATLADGTLSHYGFGWRIDPENPQVVQHSGSLNGFRTFIRREMDKQYCIILLTNHSNDWLEEIVMKLVDILHSKQQALP